MKHTASYMVHLLCTCLLLVSFVIISCKKIVEVELPIDKVTSATVFENDQLATAAILGIYSQMMPPTLFFSSGGTTVYAGLSADELYPTGTSANDQEFVKNTLQPSNSILRLNIWLRLYKHIYQANACIEGLNGSKTITPSLKDQLLAEASFCRAFCYFYLANLFGDAPLVTATAYTTNAILPRTPVAQLWAQVIADLEAAKTGLPEEYPAASRVRPNKWAAAALLARTYLYLGQWQKAETEATAIINSGLYQLQPALNDVFLPESMEAIWQLMPVEEGFNTTEARSFVPASSASAKPAYAITPQLLAAFEPGDARKTAWIGKKTVSSQLYHYPFKYKIRDIGLPVTEYYMVLRLAEVLLIRAEARARQEMISDALTDLNAVRSRAGLPPSSATTQPALLEAIEKERQTELFAEWGHRWLDLKRTGKANERLSPLKPAWQPHAVLFPIPQNELLQNPALTQNPGY